MNKNLPALRDKASHLTKSPGVYIMKNSAKDIIYIGKAKNLHNRVSSYFRENPDHTPKVAKMVSLVEDFEFIVTNSEYEALLLECSLIKQHMPKYNILLKDDKGYHYIKITNGDYPRIKTALQYENDSATYLGPYISGFVTKNTVEEVNRIFMLPVCNRRFSKSDRARPCLNYHIKRCMGVCTGKISPKEYAAIIEQAVDFIKGGSKETIKKLKDAMEQAAENLDFELAASLRDRIYAIEKAGDSQLIIEESLRDTDVFAQAHNVDDFCISVLSYRNGRLFNKNTFFFSNAISDDSMCEFIASFYATSSDIPKSIIIENSFDGIELCQQMLREKSCHAVYFTIPQKGQGKALLSMCKNNAYEELSLKKRRSSSEITALEELQSALGLEKTPLYIEAYDISNLSSSSMVAGMVVFENGRPLKNAYKKFSIKSIDIQNDYASMREVLERRFLHYCDENEDDMGFKHLPDLIFVDGGKGQVNAVEPILRKMGIDVPVFGIVKNSKHRTRAISHSGGEIEISSKSNAFMMITRIQDEMHRFAITFQRKKHAKESLEPLLTSVRGIGPKKAQKIILHFKTRQALANASVEELAQVAAINKETAAELAKIIENMS
ncbi:MAG: excinuclease ABC subunit UvrC [Oscillospiraceae bacterium]|nr:excinuclease ABC subunit UvrC [Oscillospiraceae bacterium]